MFLFFSLRVQKSKELSALQSELEQQKQLVEDFRAETERERESRIKSMKIEEQLTIAQAQVEDLKNALEQTRKMKLSKVRFGTEIFYAVIFFVSRERAVR